MKKTLQPATLLGATLLRRLNLIFLGLIPRTNRLRRLGGAWQITRHVSSGKLRRDPDTGEILGVQLTAFEPRVDEDGLSVDWVQFYLGSRDRQLNCVRRTLNRCRKVGKKDKLGLVEISAVLSAGIETDVDLQVVHTPIVLSRRYNLAHSEIDGIAKGNIRAQEMIALQTIAIHTQVMDFG